MCRHADTWNDADTYHPARGFEIAANTIMYMLHPDRPETSDDHLCGYELLTGRTSVSGRTARC